VSKDPGFFLEAEFKEVSSGLIGDVPVVIGQLAAVQPSVLVFAAALSRYGLGHGPRGFGATEAEAVADLFRTVLD